MQRAAVWSVGGRGCSVVEVKDTTKVGSALAITIMLNDIGRGQRGVPAADGASITQKQPAGSPPAPVTAPWTQSPCVVLDPFAGSGTVGLVADRLGRDAILIEINSEYADMARARITGDAPLFAKVG